jgi:2,5-furandicarboxylate decarboxylase 1
MSLREYIQALEHTGKISKINEPISRHLEISGLLKQVEPMPVLFTNVIDSSFRVAGNLFCTKASFTDYFGVPITGIIPTLLSAIKKRTRCEVVDRAACQEVVINKPDLDQLPILFHCEKDGGNYISSGVVISGHPIYGQNADFHRCMQFSQDKMSVRVVRNRHFDLYLRDQNKLDIAICVGNSPNILAAAATSVELGINELDIANAFEPFQVVRAITSDLLVPAESEFVIEGTVYLDNTHEEGPFVDLTETYDIVRYEPVFEVKAITHRHDAIWHALLPGGLEHKLLMGMPREPIIFNKVNDVVHCLDVNVNPGGCSWLHAIVKIDKQFEDDGRKAIHAAFAGHSSCKHVYVVDKDIDIYNPLEVEWAMATRFQGDRDLIIFDRSTGSSLDPSADTGTHLTTRVGFDLTAPLASEGKSFHKAVFPCVDIEKFIKSKNSAMEIE